MRYQTQTLAVTSVNFTYIVHIFTVVYSISSTAHKLQYDEQAQTEAPAASAMRRHDAYHENLWDFPPP